MRNTIRLPADIEILTSFLNGDDMDSEGGVQIIPETEPSGKFNKLKKLTVMLGDKVLFTITPKERRQSTMRPEVVLQETP